MAVSHPPGFYVGMCFKAHADARNFAGNVPTETIWTCLGVRLP